MSPGPWTLVCREGQLGTLVQEQEQKQDVAKLHATNYSEDNFVADSPQPLLKVLLSDILA